MREKKKQKGIRKIVKGKEEREKRCIENDSRKGEIEMEMEKKWELLRGIGGWRHRVNGEREWKRDMKEKKMIY